MLDRQEEVLYKGGAKIRDTSRFKLRKKKLRNDDKRIQGDEKEIAQRYKKMIRKSGSSQKSGQQRLALTRLQLVHLKQRHYITQHCYSQRSHTLVANSKRLLFKTKISEGLVDSSWHKRNHFYMHKKNVANTKQLCCLSRLLVSTLDASSR